MVDFKRDVEKAMSSAGGYVGCGYENERAKM